MKKTLTTTTNIHCKVRGEQNNFHWCASKSDDCQPKMSNFPRSHGNHTSDRAAEGASRYDALADCCDASLANMPKGTLPLRSATSRRNGYNPHLFAGRDTRSGVRMRLGGYESVLKTKFFARKNREVLAAAVLKRVNSHPQSPFAAVDKRRKMQAAHLSANMLETSMNKAYAVLATSADNAPGAQTGPSTSQPWLAPAHKFNAVPAPTMNSEQAVLKKMNALTVQLMSEQIISETVQLSRFHTHLSGAVPVAEYPKMLPAEQQRNAGTHLQFPYYDDITSEPKTGTRNMHTGPAYDLNRC